MVLGLIYLTLFLYTGHGHEFPKFIFLWQIRFQSSPVP